MSEQKKIEFSTPAAVVAAGVIIACAILYSNAHPAASAAGAGEGQNQPAVEAHVKAPSKDDHIIGDPNAKVVLIEYSDFECPYCGLIHPTLKGLVDSSGGNIAWVMRNLPLKAIHPEANAAANAAECIAAQLGNDGWWKYADAVFKNQDKLSSSYSARLAREFGADMTAYSACVSSNKYQNKIDADESDATQSGGRGTPFTVVYGNGKQVPVSGALSASNFQSVIKGL